MKLIIGLGSGSTKGIDHKNISMVVSDFAGRTSMDKINLDVREVSMKYTSFVLVINLLRRY